MKRHRDCGYTRAVLSRHLELVDLDGEHWANWLELLWPPGLDRGFGYALAFTRGDELVRLITDRAGVVAPEAARWRGREPRALAALRHELDVGVLLAIDDGALPRLLAEAEGQLSLADDYVAQWVTLWLAVKRAAARGDLCMDPPLLELLPAPSAEILQRTFDLLVPDDTAVAAYVFDDHRRGLHASIIASKEAGDIVFVTTHLGVADEVDAGALARDWRRDYPRVTRAIGGRFDPVSIAVFAERRAIERVMTGPPDQLARELGQRQVVVDPAPVWLRALLGGAVLAGSASRGAAALSRFVPPSARRLAADVARQAQDRIKDAGFDPWATLGFNPVELWLDLRRLFQRPG